jgi:hypothetical protein
MTLDEALRVSTTEHYLARRAWIEKGSKIRLVSSAKTIEEFQVELTKESLDADDWDIYDVR